MVVHPSKAWTVPFICPSFLGYLSLESFHLHWGLVTSPNPQGTGRKERSRRVALGPVPGRSGVFSWKKGGKRLREEMAAPGWGRTRSPPGS